MAQEWVVGEVGPEIVWPMLGKWTVWPAGQERPAPNASE